MSIFRFANASALDAQLETPLRGVVLTFSGSKRQKQKIEQCNMAVKPRRAYTKAGPSSATRARAAARTSAADMSRQAYYAMRRAQTSNRRPADFRPVGHEIKAVDVAIQNAFRLPATNSCNLLNGIQTGAAFFNRVGSRVELKNLHIRGQITNAATATVTMLRMIVVYDRQPTGALPTVSDLLQSRDQTGAATNPGSAEINLDNRDRFSIIRDMQLYAPPVTNTAGVLTNGPQFPGNDDQQWDVNEFIKLRGLGTHYKSSSNPCTIADIATGALYCFFVTNLSDNTWQFSGNFRLRYRDT